MSDTDARGVEHEEKVIDLYIGAWDEAVQSTGFERLYLLLLVGFITTASLPFLPLIWLCEKIGIFGLESGWSLP